MRRTAYTLFALAALLWTGCNEYTDPLPDDTAGREIAFSCVEAGTRAEEITSETIASFRVSAVWRKATGEYVDDFMNQQAVEKEGRNWVYSPSYYMPSTGQVDFFAFSPADASVNNFTIEGENHNLISFTYDVTSDLLRQQDFMVATALEQKTPSVSLLFQHALASVQIKILNSYPIYTIRVSELRLLNFCRQGVLTHTVTDGSSVWQWSNQEKPTSYLLVQDESIRIDNDSERVFPDPETEGPLMILPQTTIGDAYVYITYSIFDSDGENIESTTTAYPIDGRFKMGQKYVFQITL